MSKGHAACRGCTYNPGQVHCAIHCFTAALPRVVEILVFARFDYNVYSLDTLLALNTDDLEELFPPFSMGVRARLQKACRTEPYR